LILAAALPVRAYTAVDTASTGGCADSPGTAYDHIALIIDDLGNNLSRGQAAVDLPGKITYAIIPFTPSSRKLAQQALLADKEVMLHAPMSAVDDAALGEGGLTPQLSREEFLSTLTAALDSLPGVSGANNHMGSDLTTRRKQMAWLMQELRWRDLYFVDSRTSDQTVAASVAAEFRVPHLSRQVFLDNNRDTNKIDERFDALVTLAKKQGLAVGIGHPYPETIEYLRGALPKLEEQGVRLAFVSEALELQEVTLAKCETAESETLVSSEPLVTPAQAVVRRSGVQRPHNRHSTVTGFRNAGTPLARE
jgi:polysaccharide deacetylase 2 family uncharacterized protein YibQ